MTEYYRGHLKQHAAFWVSYRDLSHPDRFNAFIEFYEQVAREVSNSACSLRDAGYALEPGYYDIDIQAFPHGGDMTIVCLRARDLASGYYDSDNEAESDWRQIVEIMHKYIENE